MDFEQFGNLYGDPKELESLKDTLKTIKRIEAGEQFTAPKDLFCPECRQQTYQFGTNFVWQNIFVTGECTSCGIKIFSLISKQLYTFLEPDSLEHKAIKDSMLKLCQGTRFKKKKDFQDAAIKKTFSDSWVGDIGKFFSDEDKDKLSQRFQQLISSYYVKAYFEEDMSRVKPKASKINCSMDKKKKYNDIITLDKIKPIENLPDSLEALIPSMKAYRQYIPRSLHGEKDLSVLATAYDKKWNTLLIGDTGVGKTSVIEAMCAKAKLPLKTINCNGQIALEDVLGQYIPTKEGWKWSSGALIRMMLHGGVFYADEINFAPAKVLAVFNSILDHRRQITLTLKDGRTVVKAHPQFWFVAAMNPDYEGTTPLNAALKDRFLLKLIYDYDIEIEQKLVNDSSLIQLAGKLREMYHKGEITTPVSTRNLMAYKEIEKVVGKQMAIDNFLNAFDVDERPAVAQIVDVMIRGF